MFKVIKYSLILVISIFIIVFIIYYFMFKPHYLVTFNSNGGSIIAPIEIDSKKKVKEPTAPIRDGYTFTGWYLNDQKFDFNSQIKTNITLTAHWKELKENKYYIAFDTLNGTPINPIEIEENNHIDNIPTPTKEGYEFIGWYYQNKEFDFNKPITSNLVLIAKYQKINSTKNMITISFNTNGANQIEDIEIEKGSIIKMPKDPYKEGYTFAGWYHDEQEFDFSKVVSEDITLTAKWSKN